MRLCRGLGRLAQVLTFGLLAVPVAGVQTTSSPSQPPIGGFQLTGDPRSATGATWTFRGTVDGVRYDLAGVLYRPPGDGLLPAVILSHGYEGSGAMFANVVAPTMVGWGLVCIAPNYTHATGVPLGAPGSGAPVDRGASRANLERLHMTLTLLLTLGYVDRTRIALHGHSMGAYLEAAAAGAYPADFRVASSTGGGVRPDRFRSGPAPDSGAVRAIRIPFQLHHGDEDEVVPLEYDQHFAALLAQHGVPHELFTYPGGHLAPRADLRMFERVHAWYAQYGMFSAGALGS